MPVVVRIPFNKKKQIENLLKKMKIPVLETSFSDYLIILSEDTEKLKQVPILNNYVSTFIVTSYSESTRLTHTPNQKDPLKIGDSVKLSRGSFEGMSGIVKSIYDNKVTVCVNCLGLQTEIDVDLEDCIKK